jgi:hypothetical protein
LESDQTRVVTLKPPARKSSRKRTQRDYANLNSGLESDPRKWMRLLQGKVIGDATFKRMKGADVGLEWLDTDENAMREPIVVDIPDGLGMKMPPKTFTVDDVAELVGEDTQVEVIGKYFRHYLYYLTCFLRRRCYSIHISRLDTGQVGGVFQPRTLLPRENIECDILGGLWDKIGGQDLATTFGPRDGLG